MSVHTGAEVLREVLATAGVCVRPSANEAATWPCYVGHLPKTPDNAVCIYDTGGYRAGRIQTTGETLSKPGWQVRVRATGHSVGAARMHLIQNALDGILRDSVMIDGVAYTVQAVTQVGTVIPLGLEPDGARVQFTLNGTITFKTNT